MNRFSGIKSNVLSTDPFVVVKMELGNRRSWEKTLSILVLSDEECLKQVSLNESKKCWDKETRLFFKVLRAAGLL